MSQIIANTGKRFDSHAPDAEAPAQLAEGCNTPLNDPNTLDQSVVKAERIDERAGFEKEFPTPEGLVYCTQRGTYIRSLGASTSDSFAREHYAYRAAFAAWMRRAWKYGRAQA